MRPSPAQRTGARPDSAARCGLPQRPEMPNGWLARDNVRPPALSDVYVKCSPRSPGDRARRSAPIFHGVPGLTAAEKGEASPSQRHDSQLARDLLGGSCWGTAKPARAQSCDDNQKFLKSISVRAATRAKSEHPPSDRPREGHDHKRPERPFCMAFAIMLYELRAAHSGGSARVSQEQESSQNVTLRLHFPDASTHDVSASRAACSIPI